MHMVSTNIGVAALMINLESGTISIDNEEVSIKEVSDEIIVLRAKKGEVEIRTRDFYLALEIPNNQSSIGCCIAKQIQARGTNAQNVARRIIASMMDEQPYHGDKKPCIVCHQDTKWHLRGIAGVDYPYAYTGVPVCLGHDEKAKAKLAVDAGLPEPAKKGGKAKNTTYPVGNE